ncbi:MAG TPA: hypothetical protein VM779_15865 [Thermoanaerobaculia bacterium]|nr:hypothetical protein [Thermoanaerobaculia bacterium]
MTALSIITLGDVHTEHLAPLGGHFERLEQLVLDVHARDPLSRHRAEFNRAVDAASHDWILVVREREQVDEALAAEIAAAANEARAWGFRIRSVPWYAGRPLRIGEGGGEVRLLHKRHYLRFANKGEWEEIAVQGTIVRLRSVLRSVTFETAAEHRAWLERTAVPHSAVRRVLVFLRDAIGSGTFDGNTLRYIWMEAGFDRTTPAP